MKSVQESIINSTDLGVVDRKSVKSTEKNLYFAALERTVYTAENKTEKARLTSGSQRLAHSILILEIMKKLRNEARELKF